jgi:flagellar biosynthesis GTPase FlhF
LSTPTRTYRGRAIDELIPRIQQELGSEAIIVRRREGLTGGILGFFQHPYVELEAMPGSPRIDIYDEEESAVPPPPLSPPPPLPALDRPRAPEPPASAPPSPFYMREPVAPPAYGGAYVTAHLAALARAERSQPVRRAQSVERPPGLGTPRVEFEELIPHDRAPRRAGELAHAPPHRAAPERRTVAPGSQGRARAGVERSLCRLGISEELAHELIDGATAHTLPLAPRLGLAQAVRMTLAQRIPVAEALPTHGAAVVVVGAGGAGKTATCAALLGAYRAGSTMPASCATLIRPSERGELQLILSPQIMKPTSANAPRALRALRKAKADGLAVVDTPRLSPVDRAGIRELARLLGEWKPERVVVALPATLGATAAAQLLEALKPLGANALAVTHGDETDQIGVAVEAACTFGLAPEYILDRSRSGGWRLSRIDPTGLAAKLLQ